MTSLILRYISQEDGATAIEYGMIVALISIAVGILAFAIGDEMNISFTTILTGLQG